MRWFYRLFMRCGLARCPRCWRRLIRIDNKPPRNLCVKHGELDIEGVPVKHGDPTGVE